MAALGTGWADRLPPTSGDAVPQHPVPCYHTGEGTQPAMFDLAWSEIALIGVVALIAIGPKDLPVAIKAVAGAIKKARRMAAEFQGHVDEMVREADLHDVRDQFNEIRNFDIKGKILGAVDSDGSLRRTINDSQFSAPPPPVTPVSFDAAPAETIVAPHSDTAIAAPDAPPAFIPPAFIPPGEAAVYPPTAPSPPVSAAPPPMIPPAEAEPSAAPHAGVPDTAPGGVPPVPRELATHPATHD